MALDFQTVDVRFTQGLDTHDQPKLVIPGKWATLRNAALDQDGTPQRRDGIAPLVAAAVGNGLATYNKELLVVNGGAVSSVSTGGVDQVKTVSGRLGYVGISKQEIRGSTTKLDSCDMAIGDGYACYVWLEMSPDVTSTVIGLRYSVVDETTGTLLIANEPLINSATAFSPRVVFAGNAFFIFFYETAGADSLRCGVVLTSAPSVPPGTVVSLVSSANLSPRNLDAFSIDGTFATVVYGWADGSTSVRALSVTQTLGLPAVSAGPTNLISEAQLPIANLCGLACVASSPTLGGIFTLGFGATAASGVAGVTVDNNLVVVIGATQLYATGPVVNGPCHITATVFGGNFWIFTDNQSSYSTAALTPLRALGAVTPTLGAPAVSANASSSASFGFGATDPSGPQGPWIAGKAFATSTGLFLPVCVINNYANGGGAANNPRVLNEQNTFFVMEINTTTGVGTVVAKALYGTYGVVAISGLPPRVSTPSSTPAVASGGFAVACTEAGRLSLIGGRNASAVGVVRLGLAPNTTVAPIRAQLGETAYLAGGSISAYDGGITEFGFNLFPEGIDVEVVNGAGTMTDGVHQVVVVAEWVDNAGQRVQSAPCLAVSVTTVGGNDALRIRCPSLLLTQKTGVMFVPYITQAGGLTFNRAVTNAAGGGGTPNNQAAAFTTLADITLPDADYASNELLYTQPNQAGTTLPNVAPGPSNAVAVIQNRLFFDRADQAGQFGFSQQYINNLGLQCNEQLGGSVDVTAGRIVGFSGLDEKVIIFCERKPYVVYGSGPNAAGGFSNYSDPQEIPSDVGCSEARSILRMPEGIIFKSPKGWYLLGRDLGVQYIGEGVAAFDGNNVTSAVLLEDRQQCRFSSLSGSQLIYDYAVSGGQWSTAVYRRTGSGGASYAVRDAAWWPTLGVYVSVSLVDGLNQDTPGVFLDQPGASTPAAIAVTMQTSWLRMSIINGFQRVRRMFLTGTSPNAPTSTLVVTVDFDDAYGLIAPGSYSFTVAYGTMFPTFTVGLPVDLRHHMVTQKCKSVAFTFVDTPTTANPSGVNFQALSLELGMKRGVRKLPAAQST